MCAVPSFRAMKLAWPGAAITLVGLPWAKSFVARFARYLDAFQEFPGFDGVPERGFEPARMRAFLARRTSFDIAIQLHGNGSVTNRFLPKLRPCFTAGFFPAGQPCPDPARFIPYPDGEHEIRRLLLLMHHLGIPLAGEDLEFPLTHQDHHEANRILTTGGLRAGDFVCLHPGARDPKRRWPLEDFMQIGEALAAKGFRIVLTGTGEEAEQTSLLRGRLGASCLDLAGQTSLGALGGLLKNARLLISNDTGVSHLAVALRVPSVVIFSGSDPRRWAPLDKTRHRALGDPFASPTSQATPAAVLAEAFSLLSETPLRVEARDGGFPVLTPVNWSQVKRVLLVHDGSEADVLLLAPCVAALMSRWSSLSLLTSPAGAAVAPLFRGVDRLLVASPDALVEPVAAVAVRELVDQLCTGAFDAALIFTRPDQSPYTAAYICYLAGIPLRIAASKEFGGALLTHWVRKLPESAGPEERYLRLLRAVALPSYPPDSGLAIPAADEALIKAKLPGDFVLLDHAAVPLENVESVAQRLESITGMRVLRDPGSRSASVIERAGLTKFSRLVITADSLTARLADAFGCPLIATGVAAVPSDEWRPRRSFSKSLAGDQADQARLFQAVRTLLWLRGKAGVRDQESEIRIESQSPQSVGFQSDFRLLTSVFL